MISTCKYKNNNDKVKYVNLNQQKFQMKTFSDAT